MDWLPLTSTEQIEEIEKKSFEPSIKGVLIFKHSTRCSISSVALSRFERSWKYSQEEFPAYFLDLIKYRSLSREIAERYDVVHESPQILIISNGNCIYDASHSEIRVENIPEFK